jgi:hypothetical protein
MKKTGKCFCCCEHKILTKEHIIPQSLGGKLSAWIYCKECNDKFGDEIDAELTNKFRYFSTSLKIDRDRGKNQHQPFNVYFPKKNIELTSNGSELKRKKPVVEIIKEGDKVVFASVIARSAKELDRIILGLKEKHSLTHEFDTKNETIPGPIEVEREFVFDNSLIRRAVSKIAYNLICIKIPEKYVFSPSFDEIRSYIRFGAEKDMASANFRNTSFMVDNIRPLHKIHISFNRPKKLVIGFICLFGIFRYTILLSKDINIVIDLADLDYTFDPTTGKEICTKPNFIAPEIGIDDTLRPKHSKELVLRELKKGHKILENYIEGHQNIEIEHTE